MEPVIVCATDFSVNARHAADYAALLAQQLKAILHLYNGYHIPVVLNEVSIPMEIETEQQVEDGLGKMMAEEKERLERKYPSLHVRTMIEAGMAGESVAAYAEDKNAILIVTGISSRTPAGQYFIGSTAISIVNNGTVPVLIVPHETIAKPIAHIAFAWDHLEPKQINGIEILHTLIQRSSASLEVVRVCKQGENISGSINEMQQVKDFDHIPHSFSAIEDDNVENGLVHFVERNHIDLLMVVHRHHGFFQRVFTRSHTDKLAYAVKIPLLVLHEK